MFQSTGALKKLKLKEQRTSFNILIKYMNILKTFYAAQKSFSMEFLTVMSEQFYMFRFLDNI